MEVHCFWLSVILLNYVHISTSNLAQKMQAVSYLTTYGYIDQELEIPCAVDDELYEKGIKDFQNFFGINETGGTNRETLDFMELNRCGRRDVEPIVFDVDGDKGIWKRKFVKYQIMNYPQYLNERITDKIVSKAFMLWREHVNIKFKNVTENPDITIKFITEENNNVFYKNNKITATSNPAGLLGEIFINDNIIWTTHLEYGNDLYMAVAHQIGHVLGLDHSNEVNSIMHPIQKYYDSNYSLAAKDISDIKKLYSLNGEVSENFKLCDALENLNSLFLTLNGKFYYVFIGDYFWKVNSNGTSISGYPKLISSVWKIRGPISAAFQGENGLIYLFKKDKYWKYQGNLMDNTSPHSLEDFNPTKPTVVNGAVHLNNTIYLRDTENLYVYDISSDATTKYKSMRSLRNTCSTIFVLGNPTVKDLACIYKGATYLLRQSQGIYDRNYGTYGGFEAVKSEKALDDVLFC